MVREAPEDRISVVGGLFVLCGAWRRISGYKVNLWFQGSPAAAPSTAKFAY